MSKHHLPPHQPLKLNTTIIMRKWRGVALPKGRSIAHNLLIANKIVFISFDIETGGEYCGILPLSAEVFWPQLVLKDTAKGVSVKKRTGTRASHLSRTVHVCSLTKDMCSSRTQAQASVRTREHKTLVREQHRRYNSNASTSASAFSFVCPHECPKKTRK